LPETLATLTLGEDAHADAEDAAQDISEVECTAEEPSELAAAFKTEAPLEDTEDPMEEG
jgi:hypothetical protein